MTSAPINTSLLLIFASGNILNMRVNITVVTPILIIIPIVFTKDSATFGLLVMNLLLISVMRLVMVKVMSRIKAKARMTEKDSNLFMIYLSQLFLGTAFIPQMVFRELCISAKTVVAENGDTYADYCGK